MLNETDAAFARALLRIAEALCGIAAGAVLLAIALALGALAWAAYSALRRRRDRGK